MKELHCTTKQEESKLWSKFTRRPPSWIWAFQISGPPQLLRVSLTIVYTCQGHVLESLKMAFFIVILDSKYSKMTPKFVKQKSHWLHSSIKFANPGYEKGNTAQNISSQFDNNMYLISDFRVYEIIIRTKDNVSLFHQLPCSIIWAGLWNKQNWHEHKAISVCHNCWCADKKQKMYYFFPSTKHSYLQCCYKIYQKFMAHWCFCDPEIWQFLTLDDNTYKM